MQNFFIDWFRGNPQAERWNNLAIVVGSLCVVPLTLTLLYPQPAFMGILAVMSVTWLWCMVRAYLYSKQSQDGS